MTPTVQWLGDRAVLVLVSDPDEREQLHDVLAAALPALAIRRGLRELLLEGVAPAATLLFDVEHALSAGGDSGGAARNASRIVSLPVRYDGEDLAGVAQLLGCSVTDVVRGHAEQSWRVAMMGFAPGFGYLEPVGRPTLDWGSLARRDSPRTRVPGGSVAVAAGMSAVYPQEMPGGWHLLGVTSVPMFDVARSEQPSTVGPGDVVRFLPSDRFAE